eukprot:3436995-Amphidinium_carterae.1
MSGVRVQGKMKKSDLHICCGKALFVLKSETAKSTTDTKCPLHDQSFQNVGGDENPIFDLSVQFLSVSHQTPSPFTAVQSFICGDSHGLVLPTLGPKLGPLQQCKPGTRLEPTRDAFLFTLLQHDHGKFPSISHGITKRFNQPIAPQN